MKLNRAQVKFFANYVESELGIVYDEQNFFQLEQRLEKITQALNLSSSVDLYLKAMEGIKGDLKTLLLDVSTNNETSFFRDPKVFKAVETIMLPQLRAKFPQTLIYRMWSAAASTGQEAYSLAMLIDEFAEKSPGHPRFEVVATDISETVLKKAKSACYTQLEIQRGLPAQRMLKYFKKNAEGGWEFRQDLRSMVRFSKFNLLESPVGFGQFHIIFCRYVLIYQDSDRKKQILKRLIDCLVPGGCLFLGASESALGLTDRLRQASADGAIYYEKKE